MSASSPLVVTTAREFRAECERLRREAPRGLGLVPTMGALHGGHRALMRKAAEEADRVAVTIFVNPAQFGPNEDFARYPRDLAGDLAACAAEGVSLVFAPAAEEMYAAGDATRVHVARLTERLCGPRRPGHFDGVATVVTKLFALAGPCVAVFGRKDYQQLKVIERLVADLLLPVRIVGHPTLRDPDGLASSSRNRYLSPAERERALTLPRMLAACAARFDAGEREPEVLLELARSLVADGGLRLDYLELLDAETLQPVSGALEQGDAGIFVAAYVGNTRLIDNLILGIDQAPPAPKGGAAAAS